MKYISGIIICLFVVFWSCKQKTGEMNILKDPDAFIVEITTPAGKADSHSFLPFPANFADLPQNPETSVLVLAESMPRGTSLSVRALGTLLLKEQQRIHNIIIASPVDTARQLTKTMNFQQFIVENAGEKQIIQDWFLFRKGLGVVELVGWKDEKYALEQVKE